LGKVEKAENILNNIMKFLAQERIKNYAGNLETQPFPSNKFGVNESEVSTILQQIYFYKKKKENSLLIAEEGRGRVFSDSIFRRLNPLSDEQVDRVNSSWDRVTNKMKETIIKLVEEMNEGTRYLFENLSPELKKLYDVSPEKLQEAENERIREVQENFGKSYIPSEVFYSLTSATYPWLNPITIEEIQQISKKTNATLVEFSILSDFPQYDVYRKYNESGDLFSLHKIVSSSKNALKNYKEETKLLIWVIKPNGEIIAREVDLQSIDAPIKDIIPELRRTIHSRGNNKDESPFQEGDTVKKKNDPYDDASYTIKSVDTEKREVHLVDLLKPLSFDEVKKVDPTVKTNLQLQTLHEILIDPIADLLPQDPNEQVIFIPHKELFLVPFPALQDKEGKYLIEKHTITTAPAIQVLDLTRKQKQRIAAQPKQDVLVVGNPTMPTSRFSSEPLASLPHAESEAKAVAQYYNTKALIGDQGTEAVIASQLANYRIIHFATHGILNQIEPLESSIVLAPDGNEDGFLTAADFLNMELNAELIVLSACDTGKGRITGDGVVGLSRSLAIAGIPSILVSLWKIDDESTKELMLEFYKNLEQGNNKAQSLRQAMLTMMKKYGVYHWGAFNLIGEAE
jgi:CHAT domain-containing protein